MIILVGASASGKTEVAKMLHKKYGIVKMITTTTRPMRVGEIHARDYFFVSKDHFQELLAKDHFVEHTCYNNNFYGSGKDQVGSNKCIVVDPMGLKAFQALKNPEIKTFFLLASENKRKERMIGRGDKPVDIQARLIKDRVEFADDKIKNVDLEIDTENLTIEEVCDLVYTTYQKLLNKGRD